MDTNKAQNSNRNTESADFLVKFLSFHRAGQTGTEDLNPRLSPPNRRQTGQFRLQDRVGQITTCKTSYGKGELR